MLQSGHSYDPAFSCMVVASWSCLGDGFSEMLPMTQWARVIVRSRGACQNIWTMYPRSEEQLNYSTVPKLQKYVWKDET